MAEVERNRSGEAKPAGESPEAVMAAIAEAVVARQRATLRLASARERERTRAGRGYRHRPMLSPSLPGEGRVPVHVIRLTPMA